MNYTPDEFCQFIIENHGVGFFENPIKLKSGRTSNWYVNWRTIVNDVHLIDQLTDFLVSYLKTEWPDVDTIYGVPEGATKTALMTQFKWAKYHGCSTGSHVLSMGRAQPKIHGSANDRYFVGAPKGKVLVLEDTTTTGGSLIDTIDKLIEAKINVVGALSLTYRNEKRDDGLSVPDFFQKNYARKIPFVALSEAHTLIPLAVQKYLPDLNLIQSIQNEFKMFGTSPLEL